MTNSSFENEGEKLKVMEHRSGADKMGRLFGDLTNGTIGNLL